MHHCIVKMYTNYMEYIAIFLPIFLLLILLPYYFHKKTRLPTNWPLVGMLPALLKNRHRIHDFTLEIMEENGTTFYVKGPWFTNMKLLVTADPANANHIMNKNFQNYVKGPNLKEVFDIFGDSIFNADPQMWKYHRKMAQSTLNHSQFNQFLVEKLGEKIETGLIPVLDHAANHGLEIDLQDLFIRFAFDTISTVTMDYNPKTLSIDLPNFPFSKALDDGGQAIVYRHMLPTCVWKFQRWLGIGAEAKYEKCWKIVDDFIYGCIHRKRQEILSKNSQSSAPKGNEEAVDLMALYMHESETISDKFLRDAVLAFFVAGRDTVGTAISWFFYLMSKNPLVLSKIKEELHAISSSPDRNETFTRKFEEVDDKMVYLHAAICEALRLYPTIAFIVRAPIEADTLPSGHKVDPGTQIVFSTYAMGRMQSLWGEDCCEFKPERWIVQETGRIKYVPSYKFLAFNSGPKTCVGKNMSLTIIKAVVIAIVSKYRLQVLGDHVVPKVSVALPIKDGLKAKVAPY